MTQEAERQRGMPTHSTETRNGRPRAPGRAHSDWRARGSLRCPTEARRDSTRARMPAGARRSTRRAGPPDRRACGDWCAAEPVPQQDDPLPAEVTLERAEKQQERGGRVGTRPGLEVQSGSAAVPPEGEYGGHGQPLPAVEDVRQDGGLAAWRPGPPDDRPLGEPAFVLEDEPGAPAAGVFLPPATGPAPTGNGVLRGTRSPRGPCSHATRRRGSRRQRVARPSRR